MKNSIILFLALVFLVFQSCEGPMGPPGPPGLDGQDAEYIVGKVFEVVGTFNAQGNFGISGGYGFEIFESDKVLIYRLVGLDDRDYDIWTLLPQTRYLDQGRIFTYQYDFTIDDYVVYLEGNFDLNALTAEFTNDQVFRVLIIPADSIDARLDYSDHYGILDLMDIDESQIERRVIN